MEELARRAAAVLRENDRGGWTRPSPRLYPHQWSWDSAFVAIGLGHLDVERAVQELRSILSAQWRNGKVPHIVFDAGLPEGSYFPGPELWGTDDVADAPPGLRTSGLCQPPVHAIALHRLYRQHGAAVGPAVVELWPKLAAWHRYLHTDRDPEGSGLVTILHPWESGLDNSPRWDGALAAVEVGDLRPYRRHDLTHVASASERPTDRDYDRYLWLVECLKAIGYDDAVATATAPFRVKDVLLSAILAAADECLADLAAVADLGDPDEASGAARSLRQQAARTRAAVAATVGADGLARDHDLTAGTAVAARTVAGLAALVAGPAGDAAARAGQLGEGDPVAAAQVAALAALTGPGFTAAPGLCWPLPPSTAVDDPAFDPRAYWRGPMWPVITWLLWWALDRDGHSDVAAALRQASLEQLAAVGFAEYVEPMTGEGLGSPDQSWTAAVAIDWLAHA